MFIKANKSHAKELVSWVYEDKYSFYNMEGESLKNFTNNNYYVSLDESGKVRGFLCLGHEARISSLENYNYNDKYMDIGFGLRPDLTGKGFGFDFIKNIILFLNKEFETKDFRLSVASFNKRAIKLYGQIGFSMVNTIHSLDLGNEFIIMVFSL